LLGGGVLVLLSGGGLLLFTRGKKDPFVEVIEGLQKGDKFALDQEIVHIAPLPRTEDRRMISCCRMWSG